MPDNVDPKDLIWIQDAVDAYGTNRKVLEKLIDERKLSVAGGVPGDRRVYLLRSELDKLFQPRIIRPAQDSDVG